MDINALNEQVTENLDRPFAVTGRRAYLIGHMDGSFPDLGHHLPGEMGGLWAPPIKLADGFWFGLSTQQEAQADRPVIHWMFKENARSFTMKPGGAMREFALTVGGAAITVRQDMFVPDQEPGVLLAVTLTNNSDRAVDLVLSWLTRFDIQGAWWSEWPDRPDEAAFDANTGAIVAFDSLSTNWAAAMVGNGQAAGLAIGADLWAAEQTSSLDGEWGAKHGGIIPNPADLQGGGNSGMLHYAVSLAAGESRTLRFAIAGAWKAKKKLWRWRRIC